MPHLLADCSCHFCRYVDGAATSTLSHAFTPLSIDSFSRFLESDFTNVTSSSVADRSQSSKASRPAQASSNKLNRAAPASVKRRRLTKLSNDRESTDESSTSVRSPASQPARSRKIQARHRPFSNVRDSIHSASGLLRVPRNTNDPLSLIPPIAQFLSTEPSSDSNGKW